MGGMELKGLYLLSVNVNSSRADFPFKGCLANDCVFHFNKYERDPWIQSSILLSETPNCKFFIRHIEVYTAPGQSFVFTIKFHREVPPNSIGFGLLQRKWATLSLGQDIEVRPFQFDPIQHTLANVVLEVDFLQKKK